MEEPRNTDIPADVNSSAIGDQPTDAELLARFVEQHEKSAFESLVRRHSPMVMGVCRRVLGDAHEAEDAFQATFMVLLRKSKSIGRPELLANWLYGVAFRIARKARSKARRQQLRESSIDVLAPHDRYGEPEWVEVKTLLDEELNQLPPKLRMPLVLCYLDGKTNIEAARLLGCPDGSIANRLSVARAELKKRLLRRGMVLSAALLAVFLKDQSVSAGVSERLLETTLDRAADYFSHVTQEPGGTLTDTAQETAPTEGPSADPSSGECRPSVAVEEPGRKPRRKSKMLLRSVMWLLLFSWIVFPISDLCGGSLAGVQRRVQNAWPALFASGISDPHAPADATHMASMTTGIERSPQGLPADLSADDDERCKRCLGTNCGNGGSDSLAFRLHTSLLHKFFFGR